MGASWNLTIDDVEIMAGMGRLEAYGRDMTPTMDRIGMILEASTINRFDTGVDPDGVSWPMSQRVLLSGGKTLVDRAHGRNSISHNAAPRKVDVGTNLPYMAAHQTGFKGPAQVKSHSRRFTMVFGHPYAGVATVRAHTRQMNLPKRAFLGLSVDDKADVVAVVQEDYQAAVAGAAR